MSARIIKSVTFGVMMTLVMLISHGMKASGSLSVWVEALIRFILYTFFYFVVCLVFDYFHQRKQGKGKHEEQT